MMNQEPDSGSLMPDTFTDLGNNSYGAAIDDYQAQMDDFDLRGPNAQFIASNASYDEEGSQGGVDLGPADICAADLEEAEALLDGTASGCASSSDSTNLGTINWTWCASIDEGTNKIVGEITWNSVGVPSPVCNQSSAANYTFRVNFYTEANAYIGEAGRFSNGTISEAIWPCDGGPFKTDGISSGGSSMVLNKVVPAAAYFVGMENSKIRIKPSPNGPPPAP